MKHNSIKLTSICILISSLLIISCNKEIENKVEWGSALVYMPQAAVLNGGTNNNYPVPLNNNPAARNYVLDSVGNTMNIVLSATRSGLQPLESFTVNVESYVDTTIQILSSGAIANGVLLPQDLYTLPNEVTVDNGQREKIFFLSINTRKLMDEYQKYIDKQLVLTIGITTSPKSNIVLNQQLSKTVVIIDAKTFMQ